MCLERDRHTNASHSIRLIVGASVYKRDVRPWVNLWWEILMGEAGHCHCGCCIIFWLRGGRWMRESARVMRGMWYNDGNT